MGSILSFNTSITCGKKMGGGGRREEEERIERKRRGLRFLQQLHCVLWSVRIKLQKHRQGTGQ